MFQKSYFIGVPGGKIYSRLFDTGKRFLFLRVNKMRQALVFIHGGPGYPHNYFENMVSLSDIMPVIFYDQLGCGKSDRPSNNSLWNIERFVEELEALRNFYGLESMILNAHSWGTIVALEYALKYPDYVSGIIFESPCINIPLWLRDSNELIAKLNEKTRDVIESTKKNYRFNSAEFISAVSEYYRNYVWHDFPKPELIKYCDENSNYQVYTYMWGPCEFIVNGILKDYDKTDSLCMLTCSVIFTSGEFDEVLPETMSFYQSKCPGSSVKIFKGARHFPHINNHTEYDATIREFIEDNIDF